MKRIVWLLLIMLVVIVVASGCVRGRIEPGETNYQLKITVKVAEQGQINSYDGIYYIVLDADEDPAIGPGDDILLWKDSYYYIKLESEEFYFAQVEEESPELQLADSSYSGNKLQVIIALSDLGNPSSVDINVLTTDSDGYTTYDYLDDYFNIDTVLYSTEKGILSNDLEDDEADFDIIEVFAEITDI